MAVTLQDIATMTGVTKTTVSAVLRGRTKQARISENTARQIQEVARRLDFRMNLAAQATSTGRFGCVGLVLSTAEGRSTLPEGLLSGIHDALQTHDLHLNVARLPDDRLTSSGYVPKILRFMTADGLLINYTDHIPGQMLQLLERHIVPSIWLNAKLPVDSVYPDDFRAGLELTRGLLRRGRRRIAFVDFSHGQAELPSKHYSATDRSAGYEAALREAGLNPRLVRHAVSSVPTPERYAWARRLLEAPERPDAVIAYADTNLEPVMSAALALNVDVPGELILACFSDREVWLAGRRMPVAKVPQTELGQRAVGMLLERIAQPTRHMPALAVPTEIMGWGD